jgi:hypothetical protein
VGGEVVQEVGRDLPDARLERIQPGLGERLRGQPSQAGVVGRVDTEHVPREVRSGQPL